MSKGKAYVVVGHSNCGKSATFSALTDSPRLAWLEINGTRIFIKRMSNDDKPLSLRDFVRDVDEISKPRIMIALCPSHYDPKRLTGEILDFLARRYMPYFFVLRKSYLGNREISDAEIAPLRKRGEVEVLEQRLEASARATRLREFLAARL